MVTSLQAPKPFTDPQINMPLQTDGHSSYAANLSFSKNLARRTRNQSLNNHTKPAKYKEPQSTSMIQAKILTENQNRGEDF